MRPTIKRQTTIVIQFALLIGTTILLMGCSGPGPSAQDVVKAKLTANSWTMQTVMVDGVDKTGVYAGLSIQFTAAGFTTTHGGVVWPATGTWTFNATDGSSIKRDDGTVITVDVTDTTLKLTLSWAQTTFGGRTGSVSGVNIFSFAK